MCGPTHNGMDPLPSITNEEKILMESQQFSHASSIYIMISFAFFPYAIDYINSKPSYITGWFYFVYLFFVSLMLFCLKVAKHHVCFCQKKKMFSDSSHSPFYFQWPALQDPESLVAGSIYKLHWDQFSWFVGFLVVLMNSLPPTVLPPSFCKILCVLHNIWLWVSASVSWVVGGCLSDDNWTRH